MSRPTFLGGGERSSPLLCRRAPFCSPIHRPPIIKIASSSYLHRLSTQEANKSSSSSPLRRQRCHRRSRHHAPASEEEDRPAKSSIVGFVIFVQIVEWSIFACYPKSREEKEEHNEKETNISTTTTTSDPHPIKCAR